MQPLPGSQRTRALSPSFRRGATRHTFNACSATVAIKPSFRDASKRGQHCIITADAHFEPVWRSGKAVPTRIARADGEPMGIAGCHLRANGTGWKLQSMAVWRSCVETLKEVFPQADVVTTPAVLEKLSAKLAAKLAFWSPKMSANAPRKPVLPRALAGNTLTLDGQTIEIRGTQGPLAHRPYAWIPSIRAIVGNIGVFGNTHVWTADTPSPDLRAAWVAQLDEMTALKAELIIPGHMKVGTAVDVNAISFTKDYLQTLEKNLAATTSSAALIAAMTQSYPQLTDGAMSLDIGAKVNAGEMKW